MKQLSGYEASCEDYALHGNPQRDHEEYEESARFDQFDGRREEFYDTADEDFDQGWYANLTEEERAANDEKVAAIMDSFKTQHIDDIPF